MKKSIHLVQFVLIVFNLSILSGFSHVIAANDTGIEKGSALIYGVQLHQAYVRVQVPSNGCTKASHFSLEFENTPSALMTVLRHQTDMCRRKTFILDVKLRLPINRQNQDFTLTNTLSVPPTWMWEEEVNEE